MEMSRNGVPRCDHTDAIIHRFLTKPLTERARAPTRWRADGNGAVGVAARLLDARFARGAEELGAALGLAEAVGARLVAEGADQRAHAEARQRLEHVKGDRGGPVQEDAHVAAAHLPKHVRTGDLGWQPAAASSSSSSSSQAVAEEVSRSQQFDRS